METENIISPGDTPAISRSDRHTSGLPTAWLHRVAGVVFILAILAVVTTSVSRYLFAGPALALADQNHVTMVRQLGRSKLYSFVRHPQYTGFLLVIIGFLIQSLTLPTVVLFPILVTAYYRLAQREEGALTARFGKQYSTYQMRTPMLVPWWSQRGSKVAVLDRLHAEEAP